MSHELSTPDYAFAAAYAAGKNQVLDHCFPTFLESIFVNCTCKGVQRNQWPRVPKDLGDFCCIACFFNDWYHRHTGEWAITKDGVSEHGWIRLSGVPCTVACNTRIHWRVR